MSPENQELQKELLRQALSMLRNYPAYLEEHQPEALEEIELRLKNALALSQNKPVEVEL